MKVLIVHAGRIPVFAYGGTERVIWDLGKALAEYGHQVTYLVGAGSTCDFAQVIPLDAKRPIVAQVPNGFDIVHFQFNPKCEPDYPYIVTEHGNSKKPEPFPPNTVFLSEDHAKRYGASAFVYNGLDWAAYGDVEWCLDRPYDNSSAGYWHFLGKGSWPVKNLSGAIQVARLAKTQLRVMGASRINFSRGFRLTLSPHVRFHGMVGGSEKYDTLARSNGLIFPVRWPEPFGLAIIESLYFGCPVIGTPYGSLLEIVTIEVGTLSCAASELAQACIATKWDRHACHARAKNVFNHRVMAKNYLDYYYNILGGQRLHSNAPVLSFNGHNLLKWTNEPDSVASANLSTTPFNGVLQSQGNTKRDFIDR